MAYIVLALSALLSIAAFVTSIMVLVRLFKAKGVLHGLLGIISCGFYPFIWGWMKHKELNLTKIMAVWTGGIILPFVIQIALAGTGVFDALKVLNPGQWIGSPSPVVHKPVRQPVVKAQPKPAPSKPATATPAEKAPAPAAPTPAEKPEMGPAPAPAASPARPQMPADQEMEMEMKRLDNLIALDKKNADAYFNRGWIYAYKEDLERAEKDYAEVLNLDNRHADAYYNRGLVYVRMKQYDKAIKDFSEAITLNPRAVDALNNRGNVYFQQGKIAPAVDDYNAVLRIDPAEADTYYNRGLLYLDQGDKKRADEDFQRAAQLGNELARKRLGMAPLQ